MIQERKLKYIFLHFLINHRNKKCVISNIIDWAYEKLVQGKEITYICYLAGFTLEEADEKVETFWLYFEKALQELNITIPHLSIAEARSEYACLICQDYLMGLLCVDEAHDLLYDVWLENYYAENSVIKDSRFDVWMYLSDSIDLIKDGYGALPGFDDLTQDNYEKIFSRLAETFIAQYCKFNILK